MIRKRRTSEEVNFFERIHMVSLKSYTNFSVGRIKKKVNRTNVRNEVIRKQY